MGMMLRRLLARGVCASAPSLATLQDEPTNHLDIEAIDSLAEAINK
jgi:ATPase subunit of ABC transporter with duplicated ATPase domains